MANQYWLKRGGKMYGPYSGGKLKKLAGEGKIGPGDLISTDKRAWLLAEMVRGLSLDATVKPPQAASATVAPPPLEVAPRTGTVSRTHNQRPSLSRYEQRFPQRSSRTMWVVIGVAGVAAIVLAVAIAVWPWMPSGESIAFDEGELAQSNENSQDEVPSPRKPDVTRTTPSPQKPRATTKPPVVHKKPPRIAAKPPSRRSDPSVVTHTPEKEASKEKKVTMKGPGDSAALAPKKRDTKVASIRPPAPPKVKELTPIQAVAADVCSVTSQHYLKSGLPVAGMVFGSSLQEVLQKNRWRLGKRTKGTKDNGKLLMPDAHRNWGLRELAKRFCWYRNEEDASNVEHSRFTLLLFDNGKLRGIHRGYNYMFDKDYEYEKKHVREVFQLFGAAKKENTNTGRTPTGQSFISLIHWFPNSLVFLVYTQNEDLALWVFDRQWFQAELTVYLEEYHALLLLAVKVTKARPLFSPAKGRNPASILPTANGFKREIQDPKRGGSYWNVSYAPSDSSRRTPSFELLVPRTLEQMQTENPFGRMLNWKIKFQDYGEKNLSRLLSSTAAGRAGLLDIAFQKLFLHHFPVVTKLEGKNYRTKDGFVANWWNCELYYLPPSKPDPSRGL